MFNCLGNLRVAEVYAQRVPSQKRQRNMKMLHISLAFNTGCHKLCKREPLIRFLMQEVRKLFLEGEVNVKGL